MLSAARHQRILELLDASGSIKVSDLSRILHVSDMTIRRDIHLLDRAGLLRRVFGGAVTLKNTSDEDFFASRQIKELPRKLAIARYSTSLLSGASSIYFDGGTTCNEVARSLDDSLDLKIVTDSLNIFMMLKNKPNIELILLGGVLARDNNTFDGIFTLEMAQRIRVDVCCFSAAAFSASSISNQSLVGTAVKKTMIANSSKRILVADSSKANTQSFIELCSWSSVDIFVTDSGLPSHLADLLRSSHIDLRIVPVDLLPQKPSLATPNSRDSL